SAIALRMGLDGRHTTSGPRNEDGDPRKQSGSGGNQTAAGGLYVHCTEDEVQCARTGRRAGEVDRVFFSDGNAYYDCHGSAGVKGPATEAGSPDYHRLHTESGGGTVCHQTRAAEGKE